jgi:hypothetical protein
MAESKRLMSTLPKEYEQLPQLLQRAKEETGNGGKKESSVEEKAKEYAGTLKAEALPEKAEEPEEEDDDEPAPFIHPPRDGSAIMQASCGECHHHPAAQEDRSNLKTRLERIFGLPKTKEAEDSSVRANHDLFDFSVYKKPTA